MKQIIMKKESLFHGRITYTSNTKITISKDPFGNIEFDVKVPGYIIIKDDDGNYIPLKFDWDNGSLTEFGIMNIESIYQCYKIIFGEQKTAKAAKELIQEAVEGIW